MQSRGKCRIGRGKIGYELFRIVVRLRASDTDLGGRNFHFPHCGSLDRAEYSELLVAFRYQLVEVDIIAGTISGSSIGNCSKALSWKREGQSNCFSDYEIGCSILLVY